MSRNIDEARQKFYERIKEAGDNVTYGTVENVDEAARTCDVRVGGVTYEGVLLSAIENPALKGFTPVPKKGSGVLLARIGTSSRRFVEMFSELDKALLSVGDNLELEINDTGMRLVADRTTLQATAGGFRITRGAAGLKKTLADLCDEIGRLTVPTGTGPSGIPINKAKFEIIKQGLNDYLED